MTHYQSKHILVEERPGKKIHLVVRHGRHKLDFYLTSPLKISAAVEVEGESNSKSQTGE